MPLTRIDDYKLNVTGSLVDALMRNKVKTMRDPVHGDIHLTQIEVDIIDTEDFQRLRRLRQLGTSFLVYPGTNHTRFEHSIGTMHMATKMVYSILGNKYSSTEEPISFKDLQFIRIAGLLHDLAHIPFGHTLEDESNFFPSQWHDKARTPGKMIAKESDIGQAILKEYKKENLEELYQILSARSKKPERLMESEDDKIILVEDLKRPYIADLIGNTICADLLDYLKRDIYYCGLNEAYDERFLDYLVLQKDESGKHRVAIRLVGNDENRFRRDNISEIIHLLRLRYSLSEKVLYHHAKMSSSAMISEAVRRLKIGSSELITYGEDTVFEKLRESKDEVIKKLSKRLDKRVLYREVYWHSYLSDTEDSALGAFEKKRAELYRDPNKRIELQNKLESQNKLKEGSVIVYCPPYEMGLKEAEVQVISKKLVATRLQDVQDKLIVNEINSIKDSHKRLWRISVFVDKELDNGNKTPESILRRVAADSSKETGLSNNNEKYAGGLSFEEREDERGIYEKMYRWDVENPTSQVTPIELEEIMERSRSQKNSPTEAYPSFRSYEEFKEYLNFLRRRHN